MFIFASFSCPLCDWTQTSTFPFLCLFPFFLFSFSFPSVVRQVTQEGYLINKEDFNMESGHGCLVCSLIYTLITVTCWECHITWLLDWLEKIRIDISQSWHLIFGSDCLLSCRGQRITQTWKSIEIINVNSVLQNILFKKKT